MAISKHLRWSLLVLLAMASVSLSAAPKIQVLALFPGKAMLSVDGRNKVLAEGERAPGGIRLISATSEQAVVEINGRRETYGIGAHIGGNYSVAQRSEAKVLRGPRGAFVTDGEINGGKTRMMVDTGATAMALSSVEADRLGLDYKNDAKRTMVTTASGTAPAYQLKLDRVRIGAVEQHHVPAVVVEGSFPHIVLLGQTFLSRVQIEDRGNVMVLREKY